MVKKEKAKGSGLIQYRNSITKLTNDVKKYALSLDKNLLSVKMALMGAVRDVEKMMKERKG